MSAPCRGIMGFIFGHNFQPRFDSPQTGAAPLIQVVQHVATVSIGESVSGALRSLADCYCWTSKIYVQDVCKRCGEVVDRQRGEQFYKAEKAKAEAKADPKHKVTCQKCSCVFEADVDAVSVVCPACATKIWRGCVPEERGDEIPAAHLRETMPKVCPECFHHWRVTKDNADAPCPMCRDRKIKEQEAAVPDGDNAPRCE